MTYDLLRHWARFYEPVCDDVAWVAATLGWRHQAVWPVILKFQLSPTFDATAIAFFSDHSC